MAEEEEGDSIARIDLGIIVMMFLTLIYTLIMAQTSDRRLLLCLHYINAMRLSEIIPSRVY